MPTSNDSLQSAVAYLNTILLESEGFPGVK